MTRDVVLAPGLWMPGVSMGLLALRLARAGYATHFFGYRGRDPLEANASRLASFVREKCAARAAHFVGHSLGGVVMLEMLNRHAGIPVASAVLLGSPVRGCMAGRRMGSARLGRWMLGGCGEICPEREAAWKRDAPLGIVAGTLPLGLGRGFGRLPGPNDGVVRVVETTVDGMTERREVALGHSMLIMSGGVGRMVERFFGSGGFE